MSYTGWLIPERDRAMLLGRFPTTYPNVRAHHVTLRMGIGELPTATAGRVVGVIDDGRGVQTLIVSIDGSTERPDGHKYHITWSVADDRKSFHSIEVIQTLGWETVTPIDINLIPKAFLD
jgi:hypothetical protein